MTADNSGRLWGLQIWLVDQLEREHFMDAGAAGLLGASIGFLSGPISAWFGDYLRYRRSDKANRLRRERLNKILMNPRRKFREVEELATMIGAEEDLTKRLLLEIGARPLLTRGSTKWALISRAPFPDDTAQETDETNEPEKSQ